MELKEAMRLGLLWDAGKMVGGDAYEAAAVLAKQVEALQTDNLNLKGILQMLNDNIPEVNRALRHAQMLHAAMEKKS